MLALCNPPGWSCPVLTIKLSACRINPKILDEFYSRKAKAKHPEDVDAEE